MHNNLLKYMNLVLRLMVFNVQIKIFFTDMEAVSYECPEKKFFGKGSDKLALGFVRVKLEIRR